MNTQVVGGGALIGKSIMVVLFYVQLLGNLRPADLSIGMLPRAAGGCLSVPPQSAVSGSIRREQPQSAASRGQDNQ